MIARAADGNDDYPEDLRELLQTYLFLEYLDDGPESHGFPTVDSQDPLSLLGGRPDMSGV